MKTQSPTGSHGRAGASISNPSPWLALLCMVVYIKEEPAVQVSVPSTLNVYRDGQNLKAQAKTSRASITSTSRVQQQAWIRLKLRLLPGAVLSCRMHVPFQLNKSIVARFDEPSSILIARAFSLSGLSRVLNSNQTQNKSSEAYSILSGTSHASCDELALARRCPRCHWPQRRRR